MTYFTNKELSCPCCGMLFISDTFLSKLTEARILAGVPFAVNSACRCDAHNKEVGGSPTSSHLVSSTHSCVAMDIGVTSSAQRFKILAALIKVGFTRIGVAKTFIHVDGDLAKSQEVTWVY